MPPPEPSLHVVADSSVVRDCAESRDDDSSDSEDTDIAIPSRSLTGNSLEGHRGQRLPETKDAGWSAHDQVVPCDGAQAIRPPVQSSGLYDPVVTSRHINVITLVGREDPTTNEDSTHDNQLDSLHSPKTSIASSTTSIRSSLTFLTRSTSATSLALFDTAGGKSEIRAESSEATLSSADSPPLELDVSPVEELPPCHEPLEWVSPPTASDDVITESLDSTPGLETGPPVPVGQPLLGGKAPIFQQISTVRAPSQSPAPFGADALPSSERVPASLHAAFHSAVSPRGTIKGALFSNTVATSAARDVLLTYAHRLYSSPSQPLPTALSGALLSNGSTTTHNTSATAHPYTVQLLPLLTNLRVQHPGHLPTLLLLACVLFTVGDLQGSLHVNQEIISIDPTYVEAMSNMGTTLLAMGRRAEAEEWWWKAIKLRPAYWDCLNNLLAVLCNSASLKAGESTSAEPPRYSRALELCTYSVTRILDVSSAGLAVNVPSQELHRLQMLLATRANLRLAVMRPISAMQANEVIKDFVRAFEVMLGPWTMKDVILAVSFYALVHASDASSADIMELITSMNATSVPRVLENPLVGVRTAGDPFLSIIMRICQNVFPIPLLLPQYALQLPRVLFRATGGILPGLFAVVDDESVPPPEHVVEQANRSTSAALLMLAKFLQELSPDSQPPVFVGNVPLRPTIAVILLLYYLALAFHPTASICNNLGILLSNVNASTTVYNSNGQAEVVTGPRLAMSYYVKGLELDPNHAHLYTNMGSMLKDQGKMKEAIHMYQKALALKPDFDVALANLANAARDMGRIQDAVTYYRRVVELNPSMHEAVSGLANGLSSLCDWRDRGGLDGETLVDRYGNTVLVSEVTATSDHPWLTRLMEITQSQLEEAISWGKGSLVLEGDLDTWLVYVESLLGCSLDEPRRSLWARVLERFISHQSPSAGSISEGGFYVRLVERLMKHVQWRWYRDVYGRVHVSDLPDTFFIFNARTPKDAQLRYARPRLSSSLVNATAPSVLPFHSLTYPLDTRTMRLIAYSNATRIAQIALSQSWLPTHVYPPPRPPSRGRLNIGYISSDLNNHPLAHLMQSVFGLHDLASFNVFVYATSPSDNSAYRTKIERESQHFEDVSAWTTRSIVDKIKADNIHVLINLNGYTKGARNDVFAVRPCPVQLAFMGYAGALCAGWSDYLLVDKIIAPPSTTALECHRALQSSPTPTPVVTEPGDHIIEELGLDFDPDSESNDWVYLEKLIFMPHTAFCTDHKQSFRSTVPSSTRSLDELWNEEEDRRRKYRTSLFPDLPEGTVIFANFNQLYKICPYMKTIYATWLRILAKVPNSILWLLRFPAAGEPHLLRTAHEWAGEEVASRVRFTAVADKEQHVERARAADLFFDTLECNAHTVAADVLWSGTPIVTWPQHKLKLSSRLGASIAHATGFGPQMSVDSLDAYEERAVALAKSLSEPGGGELNRLRRALIETRETSALFDTERWVRNLEKGYWEAWKRWVEGTESLPGSEVTPDRDGRDAGCIWVEDDGPIVLHSEG